MLLLKKLLFFILVVSTFSLAQNYPNLTNSWLSFQLRKSINSKFDFAVDGGMRFNDNFMQNFSQGLARVVVRRKVGNHFLIGGGYAFFAHFSISSANTLENRPFLQANYETNIGKSFHKFRLRSEWRDYTNRQDAFRIRFQYYLRRQMKNNEKLSGILSAEQFFTPGKIAQHETRIICGLEQKISDLWAIQYAYIFRNQFSKNGLGHILQINLLFF